MKYGLSIILFLLAACSAQADLSVSPIVLAFEEGEQKRKDIELENISTRTQYLEVRAARISEPGGSPETYQTSPLPEEVGLLVAPRRVILQPGEKRLIRVIRVGAVDQIDRAWRVHISPVIGEVETNAPVAIAMVGIKALVFARPENPVTEITGARDGRNLTLTNSGTTNALLHSGEQCVSAAVCQRIPGKRLWPGMIWETTLPHDVPAVFTVQDHLAERQIEF